MKMKDYYSVLGVNKEASKDEIKKAHRKLAVKYHPDKGTGKEGEEKLKEVNEAYDTLGNDEKRKAYDESQIRRTHGGFQGFDFFNDFLNKRTKRKGFDLATTVSITFEEMFEGAGRKITVFDWKKCDPCNSNGRIFTDTTCNICRGEGFIIRGLPGSLAIRFKETCGNCSGSGKINYLCNSCNGKGFAKTPGTKDIWIPKGIMNGEKLIFKNQGAPSANGGERGDLMVEIKVEKSPIFNRIDELNIASHVYLRYHELILGCSKTHKTLHGDVKIKIPPLTSPGQKLMLKRKGIKRKGEVGNQIVEICLKMPTKEESNKELDQLEIIKNAWSNEEIRE